MEIISLKRYMVLDLSVLGIIGIITELIGVYINGVLLPLTTPIFVISVVLITLALTRWKAWGIIIIFVQALTTYLTGKYVLKDFVVEGGIELIKSDMYKIDTLIAILTGYLACSVTLLWNRLSKEPISKRGFLYKQLFLIGNCLCVILGQICIYIIFSSLGYSSSTHMANNIIPNSLLGIIVSIVVGNILFAQKLYVNQKELILQIKKDNNFEKDYYNAYKK